MTYTIKLPEFEGPFDLLLHLIRVNEMDIHDITISVITRQYLDYLDLMRELDLELAGEFLVMAATLIRIKARTLLPVPPELEEQEEEIDEILSARELVRQLVEYRKFKEASVKLRRKEEETSRLIFRNKQYVPDLPEEEKEDATTDIGLLYKAFARVLRFVDTPAYSPQINEQYAVEDKIAYIEDMLQVGSEVNLEDVFKRCFCRQEVIVTFLALLELCRMKRLVIRQENSFAPITAIASDGQLESNFED